jgi:hypothetical protein
MIHKCECGFSCTWEKNLMLHQVEHMVKLVV